MKTIKITDLNTRANFALSVEGGGNLSFLQLVKLLSELSDKKRLAKIVNGVKYIKDLPITIERG